MPVLFGCVQFWHKVEEGRTQPSSHLSLGFPETQGPQQISIHAKLLVVKVALRFSKSVFPKFTTCTKLCYFNKFTLFKNLPLWVCCRVHITFYHNAIIYPPYPIMSIYFPSPIEIAPYNLGIIVPYPFTQSSNTVLHV